MLLRVPVAVLWLALPALATPPTLSWLSQAGAQRGSQVEVKVGGTFDPWPVEVRVEGEGVTVTPGEGSGTMTVAVASDAPLGTVWIRLFNDEGASGIRPFLIGPIPEILDTEPNDAPDAAQRVVLPSVTINGRLEKSGDVDGFAVDLDAGQTLVASLLAHNTLRSPMDATLQVATPEGFVLAQVDDDQGLDPRLVFVASESGTHIIRTFAFPAAPDSSIRFAGGESYIYRLTLTTAGFVDHTQPLAFPRNQSGTVELFGWNLSDEVRHLTVDVAPECRAITLLEHPALGHAAAITRVGHEVRTEDAARAVEGAAPLSISGRIEVPGELDTFPFRFAKGEKRIIRVQGISIGSPLDPMLRVRDEQGNVVAENDDANRDVRDAELTFEAPQDGLYQVEVSDLNARGGYRHVYRLDVLPLTAEASLSVKTDHFILKSGEPLEIAVAVERRHGFDQAIELALEGLPEGVSVEPATSEPSGESARSVTLKLAGSRTSGWSGPFRIIGRNKGEGDHSPTTASFALDGLDATTEQGWLTATRPAEPAKSEEP